MKRCSARASLILMAVLLTGGWGAGWCQNRTIEEPQQVAAGTWKLVQADGIVPGAWVGKAVLRSTGSDGGSWTPELVLRILNRDRGMLVDIPSQRMFSYPIDTFTLSRDRLTFLLDAAGPGQELAFTGTFSSSFRQQGSAVTGGIVGTIQAASWRGSFYLQRAVEPKAPGEIAVDLPVGRQSEAVFLPGTLTIPGETDTFTPEKGLDVPLLVLVSGSGKADRNGNNRDVPGRNDVLALLAREMRNRGVATLRYDRRGTGEAYLLEKPSTSTSIDTHAHDLARILELGRQWVGGGRLLVAGMHEGAWIAAAALRSFKYPDEIVDGFAVLDSSGEPPMEALDSSLMALGNELHALGMQAARNLVAGQPLPALPEVLADFFAPSRLTWLASWLAFDPVRDIADCGVPVLFVRGTEDMQVSEDQFARLCAARPSAPRRFIPGMNYLLKKVENEEQNYDAFVNPAYPVHPLLADLLASWVKVTPEPEGLLLP